MKIHLYTFTHNNGPLLRLWLDYYSSLVDHITVYDNQSTDGTLDVLALYGSRVTVRTFACPYHPEPEPLTPMRNSIWKEARGKADWAVVVDSDEVLYHPLGLREYLRRAQQARFTFVRAYGFEVVSETFPQTDILSGCHSGVQVPDYSKPCAFQPLFIAETGFGVGAHGARPSGEVRWLNSAALYLLHCKRLGWDYYIERVQLNRDRHDRRPVRQNRPHIDRPNHHLRSEFDAMMAQRVRVVL